MKIRMLTGISGIDFSLAPSDETERFSDAEAGRMVASGQAELITEKPAPEPAKPAKKPKP